MNLFLSGGAPLMRNKSMIVAAVTAGLIILFLIIFPIAAKNHNSVFWAKYIVAVLALLITGLSTLQVLSASGSAWVFRGFLQTFLYALSMFRTVLHVRMTHAVILYTVLFTAVYLILFITDPANAASR